MDTVLFLTFSAAYLGLLIWGLKLAARHGWGTAANLPLLVLAALVYDNLVIGSGKFIGDGPLLHNLNLARFWIHTAVTPLLVAWALHALSRARFAWAQTGAFRIFAALLTLGLVALEYLTELRGLQIIPRQEYGTLAYTNAAPPDGPPLMVLIVAAALITAGSLLWKKQGWRWLFVGAAVMTVGSAVDLPIASGAAMNAFELMLLVSVMATKAFQDRRAAEAVQPV